ncbi:MAG: hypothetical protein ACR2Q3_17140 [Woeseiaceae bacterium]
MDTPLSQSNVSLKLSQIQKRCAELMEQEQSELRLEDGDNDQSPADGAYNPYNHV